MTLLGRDRLVDAKASQDMRDLMDYLKTRVELRKQLPAGQTIKTSIGRSLRKGSATTSRSRPWHRKIGVNNVEHEAALIDVDEALPRRYVLVALDAVYSKDDKTLLAEVAAEIDRCLENWHATRP
jgi:hypothetical protein